MSKYRFIASWTTRGVGQLLPLFRLTRVRSSVNACWMSRQYISLRAISCALWSATRAEAASTSSRLLPPPTPIAPAPSAPPPTRRNSRRSSIGHLLEERENPRGSITRFPDERRHRTGYGGSGGEAR